MGLVVREIVSIRGIDSIKKAKRCSAEFTFLFELTRAAEDIWVILVTGFGRCFFGTVYVFLSSNNTGQEKCSRTMRSRESRFIIPASAVRVICGIRGPAFV